MTEDSILYLIEGACVAWVDCRPDREEENLKGLTLPPPPGPNNNLAFPRHSWGRSFFHILQDILNHKAFFRPTEDHFVYFGYHVTDAPMTWEECEEAHAAQLLGVPTYLHAYDCYSDLTGYLWTSYSEGGGHNVLKELENIPAGKFMTLKFSITRKE